MDTSPGRDGTDLRQRLADWVAASLISGEQADAILVHEAAAVGAREAGPRRIPLVTEAVGYLGAALAFGAGMIAVGRTWNGISPAGRTTILGAATLLLVIGGLAVRASSEPAIRRLGSVLWFLAVAAAAGTAAETMADLVGSSVEAARHTTAAVTATLAAVLWLVERRTFQALALMAGIAFLVGDVTNAVSTNSADATSLSIWVVGVVFVALAWRGILVPTRAGYAMGSLLALTSLASMMLPESPRWFAFAIGLATAGALMALSVAAKENVLLGLGAVGMFVYILRIVGAYFRNTIGVPLALLIIGVALIVVSLVASRLRRLTRPSTPSAHLGARA